MAKTKKDQLVNLQEQQTVALKQMVADAKLLRTFQKNGGRGKTAAYNALKDSLKVSRSIGRKMERLTQRA